MITPDEIAAVEVFSTLPATDLERLAKAAADVLLTPGEYAAHEGDPRALFAVIEGRIEAVKMADGIERVIGTREPGDVFGEVPIALGTVFPVSFRSAPDIGSRVMRIEPRQFHSVAASSPKVAEKIGNLAAHRMTGARGLQGLASDRAVPRAIVVGERWDADCTELRRFLDRNQINFIWLTPDAEEAEEIWKGPLPQPEDLPAIRITEGDKTVVHPQHRRVADLLGLDTEADTSLYDTVIVGGGPAGLAAAVYGASEGLRTLVVEREAPGGQAGTSSRIENYLGFPSGVSGDELAGRALQQALRLGAEILVTREIRRIDAATRQLHLDGGDVIRARTIILACGVTWRRLDIDGVEKLTGRGIAYGASRSEASNTHGLDVHIIGAGNSAGQAALYAANHARSVTILCRGDDIGKSMSRYLIDQIGSRPNIDVRMRSQVTAVYGDQSLEEIDIYNSDEDQTIRHGSGGLFVFIGADAETGWMPPEVLLDKRGFVLTGPEARSDKNWPLDRDPYLLETSVPGVFACGDVRLSPVKRVAAAVGEGSMAIAFVHQYMRELDQAQRTA